MGKRCQESKALRDIHDISAFQGSEKNDDESQIHNAAKRRDEALREAGTALSAALTRTPHGAADVVEREADIARLRSRLAGLSAAVGNPTFGRLDLVDGTRVYVGRAAITACDATPIVVDWRAPVARAFYAATAARPLDVRLRRHLVVRRDLLVGHDDEWLRSPDSVAAEPGRHLLDALSAPRTGRMKDAAATLQAEQDAIIRADRRGALVVQGAPGTGKTVVALHRVAYLLYENRERYSRSGVLLLGPSRRFLEYVSEVLPALGETAVIPATIGDLHPGVAVGAAETVEAAAVKGDLAMVEVLSRAVAALQRAPDRDVDLDLGGTPLRIPEDGLRRVRDRARATGLPHEEARATCREGLVDLVTEAWASAIGTDPYDGTTWLDDDDLAALRAEVAQADELHGLVEQMWPHLTPTELLRRLWSDSELLSTAADGLLTPAEQAALRRDREAAWTVSDIALLDEAAELVGHDDTAQVEAVERARRQEESYARGVLEVLHGSRALEDDDVADEIDWEDPATSSARAAAALADRFAAEDPRTLAERALADRTWAFDHVVVDEAQELTPMEWRLIVRRCPSRSMTVVGDLAQTTRQPQPRSWAEAVEPALAGRWRLVELDVSYRTPQEVLGVASLVLARSRPDLRPPRALRRSGHPVQVWRGVRDAAAEVTDALAAVDGEEAHTGTTAVLAPLHRVERCRDVARERDVVVLTPSEAKGLEFDRVVLVAPEEMSPADQYIALTRCTSRLAIVSEARRLPWEGSVAQPSARPTDDGAAKRP